MPAEGFRETDASDLPEVRELASGLSLGAVLLAASALAARPLLFGFQDPSFANALVTFMVLLLAGIVVAKGELEGELRLPPARVALPLGFVLFLGLLLSALAPHKWPAEQRLVNWATNALVFLSVYALAAGGGQGREGARRAVMAAILATAAVVALYGVWQRLIGQGWLREEVRTTVHGLELFSRPGAAGRVLSTEVYSTFVTSNAFSGYLVLVLPAAAGLALAARAAHRMIAGVLAWALFALLGIALVLTLSKSGAVGAAAGLAVFATILWGRRAAAFVRAFLPGSRALRLACLVGVSIAGTAGAVAVLLLVLRTGSMGVRLEYWRATGRMIAENPMGVGLGGFSDHYPRYKTAAGWDVREPHNVYLSLAAEAGLAAVVALAFLIFGFFRGALPPTPRPRLGGITSRRPFGRRWGVGSGETDADAEGDGAPSGAGPPGDGRSRRSRAGDRYEPGLDARRFGWGRALALAGGLCGVLAAYVACAATESGVSSGSIVTLLIGRADGEVAVTALMHLAFFPLWGMLFWYFHRVEAGARALRAGIVAGVAALLVHGLAEFDFRVKATTLTAAAMGGLALAHARPVGIPLRGARGPLLGCVALAGLALLLWRGTLRTIGLWEQVIVAESREDYAGELEALAARATALAGPARPGEEADEEAVEKVVERAYDLEIWRAANDIRDALGARNRGLLVEGLARLRNDAREKAGEALRDAWRARRAYVDAEPGDEREVNKLGRLGRRLGRVAPELGTDAAVGDAFEAFRKRSPESYLGWLLMGHYHSSQGDMTEAASYYEEAVARYDMSPRMWRYLGDARARFDPELALDAYAEMVARNRLVEDENSTLFGDFWRAPGRPGPRTGRLLAELEYAEREVAPRSGRDGPPAEFAFRRGFILLSFRHYNGAAEAFGQALERAPGEVQFAVCRALALEMDAAALERLVQATRGGGAASTEENERAAEAAKARAREAWKAAELIRKTAPAPAADTLDRGLADFMAALVLARIRVVRNIARGGVPAPPAPPAPPAAERGEARPRPRGGDR